MQKYSHLRVYANFLLIKYSHLRKFNILSYDFENKRAHRLSKNE